MTSEFKSNLKPILILCKVFGLINMSYIFESTGLLVKSSTNTTHYAMLELIRMYTLIMFTYIVYIRGFYYVVYFRLIKFWIVIITSRLSEMWMIKLINEIIEFDRKLILLSPAFMVYHRSLSKKKWIIIFISLLSYFIGYEVYALYLWQLKTIDMSTVPVLFFGMPYITDFVVIITVCFYLNNLSNRFQTLNDFWKCLPSGLISTHSEWTNSEIVMLVESIRLLHAKLSEILKIFNFSYGLLLLGFFVYSFIDFMYIFYLMIYHELATPKVSFTQNIIKYLPLHLFNVQLIVFLMSIIVAVSWIKEEKNKIISYLRSSRISNLPVDTKIQVKMFMNQINISEFDEISALGFFNINLNLVVSILVLLMTGLASLIQLRNHPIITAMFNNTLSFYTIWKTENSDTNRSKNITL
ncbi:uncharacterized protein LOC112599218 [Melanaphis sacchari]|uniref:uncharacterized protein LOC112599218 n=1 Tax=Melanaphis sacchari TaxID=742174 RepID=UPI000DC1322E|nr:uncharacterized protein LOC112599218 [Melanaphis sacchari]